MVSFIKQSSSNHQAITRQSSDKQSPGNHQTLLSGIIRPSSGHHPAIIRPSSGNPIRQSHQAIVAHLLLGDGLLHEHLLVGAEVGRAEAVDL
eukprot:3535593-Prymnesium_polylepis.1